jgi:hypothetical protein
MKRLVAGVVVAVTVVGVAIGVTAQSGGIETPRNRAVKPAFDIVATNITTDGNTAIFSMHTAGTAGAIKPTKTGKLAGAKVFSYVWPTTLDPYEVGFDHKAGNVAFAIVLNTNPYTYLGNRPLDLSPAATLDRALVVVGFRSLKALTLLKAMTVALKGGGVPISKAIPQHTDVTHAVMSAATPIPYQVDGDDLADARKLDFKHLPNAIRLVKLH